MRIVLTGGPCSGKTTLIDELKNRGFPIVEEVARKAIKTFGRPSEKSFIDFEKWIYLTQTLHEDNLPNYQTPVFLDRGLQDAMGYCLHAIGRIPHEIVNHSNEELSKRYDKVFILDRLPIKTDAERTEDDATAQGVHEAICRVYQLTGYQPITVPIFPGDIKHGVNKRIEYIINHLENKK